jgi:hypothetical protein
MSCIVYPSLIMNLVLFFSKYPASPQLRRKKVPWTAEEEEILKVLVLLFALIPSH